MSTINFQKKYVLDESYESIKQNVNKELDRYLRYPDLYMFDDQEKSVTFSSEKLIPIISTNRPRVMLLFSNPHPYSIHHGMFLSPNTKGQENLFWSAMRDSGWINIPEEKLSPKQLADICLKVLYEGPFELIFYCYYAFPTNFPEDISKIFGKEYFNQVIEAEAYAEIRKTVQETNVEAVVTFNKGIFNLVSKDPVRLYIRRLITGELIRSHISGIDRDILIFLTFPTGWRYHEQYKQLRKDSLGAIRTSICRELTKP